MAGIIPEMTMAMQTLTTLLNLSNLAPNLAAAFKEWLKNARGDPEPFKKLSSPNLGHVKTDVIADSSLLFHHAPSTPGARIVGGKLVKPQDFELTVIPLHKLIKDFVAMHCSLDVAAEGGATSAGLARLCEELWMRSPVQKGAESQVTRMCWVSWTCNDVATWSMGKGGK